MCLLGCGGAIPPGVAYRVVEPPGCLLRLPHIERPIGSVPAPLRVEDSSLGWRTPRLRVDPVGDGSGDRRRRTWRLAEVLYCHLTSHRSHAGHGHRHRTSAWKNSSNATDGQDYRAIGKGRGIRCTVLEERLQDATAALRASEEQRRELAADYKHALNALWKANAGMARRG